MGIQLIGPVDIHSSSTFRDRIHEIESEFFFLLLTPNVPLLGEYACERMVQVAKDSGAAMVYSHYQEIKKGLRSNHPVNDYQSGSVRDDFDFGPLVLLRTEAVRSAMESEAVAYRYAGWYDLRLKLSQQHPLLHLDEYLYTIEEKDERSTDEKMFSYVDPKNRSVQLEMEAACTQHLKAIGAWLPPHFSTIDLTQGTFPVEATVVIPVRNRARTIADAIQSVLSQEADFAFNLIVVDNHSTDGTTAIVAQWAAKDRRIVHLLPEREDLGIGGCWNMGVQHPQCGRFVLQLDSDDVYSGPDTISRIVKGFYEQQCAMLVGSYRMTDIHWNTLPPGVIDHKEWTAENGRNNALRINGLGAPRAFFTPLLRRIKVPNTSYGEDYALGLQFSRHWHLGRIYDVLYLCRRWEDNSDAAIDLVRLNANNAYKDKLRTLEIEARKSINH
jgi:hypothetical protein